MTPSRLYSNHSWHKCFHCVGPIFPPLERRNKKVNTIYQVLFIKFFRVLISAVRKRVTSGAMHKVHMQFFGPFLTPCKENDVTVRLFTAHTFKKPHPPVATATLESLCGTVRWYDPLLSAEISTLWIYSNILPSTCNFSCIMGCLRNAWFLM